jgi:hypothetical protein
MDNQPVYISLDTETGGIGSDTSLLTAYFGLYDKDLELVDDLYLFCKPDDGIYRVTGKAMEINGINLAEHDKVAENKSMTGSKLYNFLRKPFDDNLDDSGNGQPLLKPLGHNVKFDILKVTDNILNEAAWDQFVSYRTLDTGTIGGFAIEVGLIPPTVSASLSSLAEYFGVGKQPETGHEANKDVWMTVAVYKCLKALFREKV